MIYKGRIKRGDILVAVNGLYVTHLPFEAVITLLRSQEAPFIYLRFLRWSYGEDRKEGDIVSQYFDEKAEVAPSRRPPPGRSIYKNVSPLYYQNKMLWCAEYYKDYNREVIGIFDSEDEAMLAHKEKMLKLEKENNNDTNGLLTLSAIKSDTEIQAEKLLKKVVLQERAEGLKKLFTLLPVPKDENKKILNFDEKLEKVKSLKDDEEKMEIDNGTEESKNTILDLNSDIDNVRLTDSQEKKLNDNNNKNKNENENLKNEDGFEETKNSMDEDEDVKVREARSVDEKVGAQDEEEEKDGKLKLKIETDEKEKKEGEKEEKAEVEEEEEEDGEIDDNSIDSQDSDSLLASSEEEEDEVIDSYELYDVFPLV